MSIPYAHLPAPIQRVYELLADHPGPDTTALPIAASLNISEPDAAAALQRLHAARLLDQLPPGDRYALAPWARQHAAHQRAQVPDPTRSEQTTRLIDWYAATATAAVPLIAPDSFRFSASAVHEAVPHDHVDGHRVLRWYAAEHRVLRNVLTAAVDRGRDDVAVELAEATWHLARTTYHHDDLAHAQHTGHTLTHHTHPPMAAVFRAREASALADLGRLADALGAAADATALARDIGDPGILALASSHSGRVHLAAGDPDEALRELTAALRQYRSVVDDHGHALAHRRIGQAHLALGHTADAVRYLDASISALIRAKHRLGAARALTYLADALTADRQASSALSAAGRAHTLLGTAAAPRYRTGLDLAAAHARYALGETTITRRLTENLITRLRHAGPGAAGDLAAATDLHAQL
ncbi:tetratricopeptide repeat protein [Amycolatopsis nalaikhensis]|uniref:Tetratricopeptide repeat protein n=1 Tax=Amycolatopsis nalaikhensis TaxID=715472 RepID=A0ABY8XYL3_9PSEU|nr:tetratricopeptide repeat protein [Amycolatopsis sp. 2-2]WIV60677.1 tetratricopeptide repeat protein [Amycolatopsis sp. 2-2]